jgi:hypothetical protein
LAAGPTRLIHPRGVRGCLLALVCLLCLGAALAPAMASAAGSSSIDGLVSHGSTPLVGIEVCASGTEDKCVQTEFGGYYSIEELEAGTYSVSFVGASYAPKTVVDIQLPEDSSAGVDADLNALGTLTGTVTDAVSHTPVEAVHVCAEFEGGGPSSCTDTEGTGEYELELPPGSYEVSFTRPGYAGKGLGGVAVTEEQTTTQDVELEETGEIEGVATNSLGGGIGETLVCVDGAKGLYYTTCQFTYPDGTYGFAELPPGEYEVEFTGLECGEGDCEVEECQRLETCTRSYVPVVYEHAATLNNGESTLIPVAAGETVEEIDGVLLAGGKIEGVVTLARTGAPLAGIEVSAIPVSVNARGQKATTNANGEYTIEGLASVEFYVRFNEPCEEETGQPACPQTYVTQFYGDATEEESSTPVLVSASTPRTGIDAAMVEVNPPVQAPTFTSSPTLGGAAAVGSTLTCSPGTWSNDPTSVTYAWLRNGASIAGQAGNTYLVTSTDQGTSLTCAVTIGNEAGSVSATSNAIAIPAAASGSGSGTGTTNPGGGGGSTSTPKAKPATAPSTATAKGGTATLTLKCGGGTACKGSLKLVYEEKAKKNGKSSVKKITVGSASFQVGAGGSKAIKVKLNGQGKSLLAEAGKKGLKVKLTGSGITARTITLKSA